MPVLFDFVGVHGYNTNVVPSRERRWIHFSNGLVFPLLLTPLCRRRRHGSKEPTHLLGIDRQVVVVLQAHSADDLATELRANETYTARPALIAIDSVACLDEADERFGQGFTRPDDP